MLRRSQAGPVLACLMLMAMAAVPAMATIRDVPAQYATIQAGIDAAVNGDEVVVAPGHYLEDITFHGKHITVRSTDPLNPDVVATTIIDANTQEVDASVVSFDNTGYGSSTLSGFTLTGATAPYGGGGVNCDQGTVTVSHNVVTGNAAQYGGGIYCSNQGTALLLDNIVTGNHATADGGGIFLASGDGVIEGNTVTGNIADGEGGGIWCLGLNAQVSHNLISANTALIGGGLESYLSDGLYDGNIVCSNSASQDGGGVACYEGFPDFRHTLIYGNSAAGNGGGFAWWGTYVVLVNTTIAGNAATGGLGGGIYGASSPQFEGKLTIVNSIVAFSGNGGGIYSEGSKDTTEVRYCDVTGNNGGNYVNMPDCTGLLGNISLDPLFADPASADYHLRSQGGRWTPGGWVLDAVTSPGVDGGEAGWQCDLEPIPNGGRVNLGFDGNTPQASRTLVIPMVIARSHKHVGTLNTLPFYVVFNVQMHRATVESNFSISPTKPGAFSWVGKKLIFTPTTPFVPDRWYTVTIRRNARSVAGVRMVADFTWGFRTAAATAPALLTATATSTRAGVEIVLHLSAAADVSVRVLNLAGREVAALPAQSLAAGTQTLLWNGRSTAGVAVAPGQYLLSVEARQEGGTAMTRMIPLAR